MNVFGFDELNELLEEKIKIETIIFPTINQKNIPNEDKERGGIEYIFTNGERFKGRMDNNQMISGIYTWPNKQEFKGDFSHNNNFKKGEILFYPSNYKLIGIYNEDKKSFEKCIYETDSYIYEGNIKRNKKNGYSSIKSKKNESFYLYKGKYDEDKRKGRCEIIAEKDGIKYKINGIYSHGKKNGIFRVYNLEKDTIPIVEFKFINDILLIEEGPFFEIRKNIRINCIEILIKENDLILLIGVENKMFLYDIIKKKDIDVIKLLEKCKISDILVLKDKKILICNDINQFYLIDIKISANSIKIIPINKFKGRDNSSYIFSIRELDNELIVSGDCKNLIFWKKTISNNIDNKMIYKENNYKNNNKIINDNNNSIINNNSIYSNNKLNNEKNNRITFWDSIKNLCNGCIEGITNYIKGEDNNEMAYNSFKEIDHFDLTHTYSFIEIKENMRSKNNIKLAVAQPDNDIVILYDIYYRNDRIDIKNEQKINNINSIINTNNIMTYKNNILYIGCKDSIKLIDINNATLINCILFETITYIGLYKNEFLLCGINKNKSLYQFQSQLIQIGIKEDKIIPLNEKSQHRHEGSIINNKFININNEEYIITLGTDKRILVTNSVLIRKEKHFNETFLNKI